MAGLALMSHGESMLISPVPRIFCALVNGPEGGGGGGGGGTGLVFRPGMEKGNFDRWPPMMDFAAVEQRILWMLVYDFRVPGRKTPSRPRP